MTTKLEQALKDLEATCEDLADLDEAFKRGRLQGLEEAAEIAGKVAHEITGKSNVAYMKRYAIVSVVAAIREKIEGAAVGAQEENTQ